MNEKMNANLRDIIRASIYNKAKESQITFGDVLDALIDCITSIILDKAIDMVNDKEIEPDKLNDFVNDNVRAVIEALPLSSQGMLDWYATKVNANEKQDQ